MFERLSLIQKNDLFDFNKFLFGSKILYLNPNKFYLIQIIFLIKVFLTTYFLSFNKIFLLNAIKYYQF